MPVEIQFSLVFGFLRCSVFQVWGFCYKQCFKMNVVHSVSYCVTMDFAVWRLFVCGCLYISFCKVLDILALNFLIKRAFCVIIIVLLKLLCVDCHVFAPSTVIWGGGGGTCRSFGWGM